MTHGKGKEKKAGVDSNKLVTAPRRQNDCYHYWKHNSAEDRANIPRSPRSSTVCYTRTRRWSGSQGRCSLPDQSIALFLFDPPLGAALQDPLGTQGL